MQAKYTEQDIEQARSVSIHRILERPQGRRISVVCPFHGDKDPSLVVYPDNSYHCYGCKAHGRNAVDFLLGLGCNFTEAIDELLKY